MARSGIYSALKNLPKDKIRHCTNFDSLHYAFDGRDNKIMGVKTDKSEKLVQFDLHMLWILEGDPSNTDDMSADDYYSDAFIKSQIRKDFGEGQSQYLIATAEAGSLDPIYVLTDDNSYPSIGDV